MQTNMDAASEWEPRRGAFRVPRAFGEGGSESMSVEENLKVIDTATKAMNDRDLDRFESLHLNSVIQRDPQHPEGIKGVKTIRAGLEPFLKAFPDIRLVVERQFGAGDWITQLSHMRGTHSGPLEVQGGRDDPRDEQVRPNAGRFGCETRGRQVCGNQPLFRSNGADGPAWAGSAGTATTEAVSQGSRGRENGDLAPALLSRLSSPVDPVAEFRSDKFRRVTSRRHG